MVRPRHCLKCKKSLANKRSDALYCSRKCKNARTAERKYASGHKSPKMTLRERRILELGYEFDGHCEICGDAVTVPHVDHDHATGKARGYLCVICNIGLGYFQDDYDRLINAAGYLRSKQ